MITKIIQIEFANPKIRAIDHLDDIKKAARHSFANLYNRHHIYLADVITYSDIGIVAVKLDIPDTCMDNFSAGRHLKGLSNWLLSNREDEYRPYIVGKRLLTYHDITVEKGEK